MSKRLFRKHLILPLLLTSFLFVFNIFSITPERIVNPFEAQVGFSKDNIPFAPFPDIASQQGLKVDPSSDLLKMFLPVAPEVLSKLGLPIKSLLISIFNHLGNIPFALWGKLPTLKSLLEKIKNQTSATKVVPPSQVPAPISKILEEVWASNDKLAKSWDKFSIQYKSLLAKYLDLYVEKMKSNPEKTIILTILVYYFGMGILKKILQESKDRLETIAAKAFFAPFDMMSYLAKGVFGIPKKIYNRLWANKTSDNNFDSSSSSSVDSTTYRPTSGREVVLKEGPGVRIVEPTPLRPLTYY